MAVSFCLYCGRETEPVNVSRAAAGVGVSGRTVYDWLDRALVHCVHRPNGMKFICVRSPVPFDGFRDVPPPDQALIPGFLVGRPQTPG